MLILPMIQILLKITLKKIKTDGNSNKTKMEAVTGLRPRETITKTSGGGRSGISRAVSSYTKALGGAKSAAKNPK